jgi:sulfopyruvate decarboxylase TPP-binding subunit
MCHRALPLLSALPLVPKVATQRCEDGVGVVAGAACSVARVVTVVVCEGVVVRGGAAGALCS